MKVRVTRATLDNWYKPGEEYDVEEKTAHIDGRDIHLLIDQESVDGVNVGIGVGHFEIVEDKPVQQGKQEYTGGSVSYYSVPVDNPTNPESDPYVAECNDIIEALDMNYAEGNAFKAIWRSCAARKFGSAKKGYDDGLYDAEKVVFFGNRLVEMAKKKVV